VFGEKVGEFSEQ